MPCSSHLDKPEVDPILRAVSHHHHGVVGVLVGAALVDASSVGLEAAVHGHGGHHGAVLRHQLLQEGLVPLPGPVAPSQVSTWYSSASKYVEEGAS